MNKHSNPVLGSTVLIWPASLSTDTHVHTVWIVPVIILYFKLWTYSNGWCTFFSQL